MVKNDHEPAFAPAELSPFRRSVVIVVLSNQVQLQVDYGLGYIIGTAIQESLPHCGTSRAVVPCS